MPLLISFLTFVLIVDCLLLMLLILVQLPKKEAGMGTAFGGGATDALFGAGTGNVLTKATKYCAALFLVLALVLSVLKPGVMKGKSNVQKELLNSAGKVETPVTPSVKAPPFTPQKQDAKSATTAATNAPAAATTPAPAATNAPAKAPAAAPAATNAPAKAAAPPAK